MSEQQVDLAQLRQLTETLSELVTYCDALQSGAGGFAYMLPQDWQGPAMSAFLTSFEAWSLGATALHTGAGGMRDLAQGALTAYEGTVETLNESWTSIESGLSG